MLKIAESSGNVTLGTISVTLHDTFQTFVERSETAFDGTETHSHTGMMHRQCRLPPFKVKLHEWTGEVLFSNRFVAVISLRSNEIDYRTDYFDGKSERWRKQFDWIDICRETLQSQIGEPHFVELPYLQNAEDFLSQNQLERLVDWTYKFAWGEVKIGFDSMSISSGLLIKYDRFQQITNWDELTAECKYCIQVETSHGSSGVQMLSATLDTIELLKHHFAFDDVLPIITDRGLSFELPDCFVSIKVVHKDNAVRYYVSRNDRVGISQADYKTLVDTLEKYIYPDA